MKRFIAGVLAALIISGTVAAQATPIAQAIALLTSGTTPFSIVGINASGYINWGTGRSSTGYGFRDSAGTIQVKNSAGSWVNVIGSGGAPTTATYITQTPAAGLSAEQPLSALASALLVNTTGTGVLTAYTGSTCTNQVVTSINALGAAGCNSVSLVSMITGTLQVSHGGTGLSAVDQGDILYASASNTLAQLAKSSSASRYLSNSGSSNNPAWSQIDLTNGVTGALGVANGGTGITTGTSGGILGFTSSGALASSVALTDHALVLGAGAGATPTPLGSLGTTITVLHGNAAGAPTFGAVDLATDVTGSIGVAQGGTGLASYTVGDLIYASGTTTLSKLAAVSANSFLRTTGVTAAPAWSATKWPNAAAAGDLLYASGTNQYANLAAVAAGSFLRSAGVTTAPVWSTTTIPNSSTTGDLLYASAANTYSNLAAVGVGRVLSSAGTGTAPVWLTNPLSTTYEVSTAFIGPGTESSTGVLRLANLATVSARNAGDSADLVLIASTAANRVLLGGTNTTGLTVVTGSNNFFVQGTSPTISSGFGSSPAIAGTATSFKVTTGGGGASSGVVLFAFTWANAPSCTANNETSAALVRATPTTTQVTISGTLTAADVISVNCFGY